MTVAEIKQTILNIYDKKVTQADRSGWACQTNLLVFINQNWHKKDDIVSVICTILSDFSKTTDEYEWGVIANIMQVMSACNLSTYPLYRKTTTKLNLANVPDTLKDTVKGYITYLC